MKKTYLLTLFLCIALYTHADRISLQQAKELAQSYIADGSSPQLAKAIRRNQAVQTDETTFAPLYIFSRGSDQGYVIVSGDNSLPEILGYTEYGDYEENNLPPAFEAWVNYFTKAVEQAQAKKAPALERKRINSSWENIPYMIKDHWSQTAPYNNLCPYLAGTTDRCVTGCVATSGSQAIHFFRADNPDTLLASTSTYSYGDNPVTTVFPKGTPIKYDLMLNSYTGSYPAEMSNAIATLMASVGAATHLTYGSSTSGQMVDLATTLNNYFNLSCTCIYKVDISLSAWENMIYNDLKAGRPILYTGYNPTAESAHAFILDGYSNGKFHFNFGWGGSADGYYTLSLEDGVNGFYEWQGMVYKITPKKQNLRGSFVKPIELSLRTTATIQAHVENRGTLAYSGVYLLAATGKAMPSISSASDKDVSTKIPSGEGVDFTFNFKPTQDKDYHLYLTDGQRTILDSITIKVKDSTPDLHLKSLTADWGADQEQANGNTYHFVNNVKAQITAVIANESDNSFEGVFKLGIKGNADGSSEEYSVSSTKSQSVIFGPHETKEVIFTSNSLTEENYYLAQLTSTATATSTHHDITFEEDSIIYFRSKAPSLACESYTDGRAKIVGAWNDAVFATLIQSYPDAVSFDLTQVEGIRRLPVAPNPNCLYYVADGSDIEGDNIIHNGVCDNLVLNNGYNFAPIADFTATDVTYVPQVEANSWEALYLPFSCDVPDGCIAKRAIESTRSKITFEMVRRIEAGTPYLYTFSSDEHNTLTAQNALITLKGGHSGDTAFVGTFCETEAPTNALALNNNEIQYFVACDSGATIKGLTGYFVIENASRIRPTNATTDPRYQALGQEIAIAYALLATNKVYSNESDCNKLLQAILTAEDVFVKQEIGLGSKITAQATLLQKAEEEFMLHLIGTPDNPADYTAHITNPSFESKTTTGWKIEQTSGYGTRPISTLAYYCSGTDGDYLFNASTVLSTKTAQLSQTISGIPAGTYKIKAKIALKEGLSAQLFAGNDSITVYANKLGSFYFKEGEITVTTTDTMLTIGVRSNHPFKADDFRLYNMGNSIPNGIDEITLSPATTETTLQVLKGGKGELVLQANGDTAVKVYTLGGMLARQTTLKAGNTATIGGLAPGIYVVGGKKVRVK